MNSNIFDSSFFGYSNVPDSIELDDRKLIPIKSLKLKYEDHSMAYSGKLFSVSTIKTICWLTAIEVHRPIKGLYCVEEEDAKFFDYLYELRRTNVIHDYIDSDDIHRLYDVFHKSPQLVNACYN
jgi:hypothetical protein